MTDPWSLLLRIDRKLDLVLRHLGLLEQLEINLMKELDDLATQVAANGDAEASAVLLLGKLHDLIVAAGTDPAKLKDLTTQLAASKEKLAQAILQNTPAA
jgi:hypothetical protein